MRRRSSGPITRTVVAIDAISGRRAHIKHPDDDLKRNDSSSGKLSLMLNQKYGSNRLHVYSESTNQSVIWLYDKSDVFVMLDCSGMDDSEVEGHMCKTKNYYLDLQCKASMERDLFGSDSSEDDENGAGPVRPPVSGKASSSSVVNQAVSTSIEENQATKQKEAQVTLLEEAHAPPHSNVAAVDINIAIAKAAVTPPIALAVGTTVFCGEHESVVVDVRMGQAKIHFKGWNKKHDVWMDFARLRLRTTTAGLAAVDNNATLPEEKEVRAPEKVESNEAKLNPAELPELPDEQQSAAHFKEAQDVTDTEFCEMIDSQKDTMKDLLQKLETERKLKEEAQQAAKKASDEKNKLEKKAKAEKEAKEAAKGKLTEAKRKFEADKRNAVEEAIKKAQKGDKQQRGGRPIKVLYDMMINMAAKFYTDAYELISKLDRVGKPVTNAKYEFYDHNAGTWKPIDLDIEKELDELVSVNKGKKKPEKYNAKYKIGSFEYETRYDTSNEEFVQKNLSTNRTTTIRKLTSSSNGLSPFDAARMKFLFTSESTMPFDFNDFEAKLDSGEFDVTEETLFSVKSVELAKLAEAMDSLSDGNKFVQTSFTATVCKTDLWVKPAKFKQWIRLGASRNYKHIRLAVHGTSDETAVKIEKDHVGFDASCLQRDVFGTGTYFGLSPSVSDAYKYHKWPKSSAIFSFLFCPPSFAKGSILYRPTSMHMNKVLVRLNGSMSVFFILLPYEKVYTLENMRSDAGTKDVDFVNGMVCNDICAILPLGKALSYCDKC